MTTKPEPTLKSKGGRPKGVRDATPRISPRRATLEYAVSRGLTPLEVLLTTMEKCWYAAADLEAAGDADPLPEDKRLERIDTLRDRANAAAVQAAPYVHPKLSAIAVKEMRESSPINAAAIAAISPAERHMLLFALRKLLGADVEDAPVIEAISDGGE